MPSEMQERIAKELRRCHGGKLTWADLSDKGKARLLEDALAVMKAMREPTQVMTEAGWNARGEVDARYTAMLDAEISLAEGGSNA